MSSSNFNGSNANATQQNSANQGSPNVVIVTSSGNQTTAQKKEKTIAALEKKLLSTENALYTLEKRLDIKTYSVKPTLESITQLFKDLVNKRFFEKLATADPSIKPILDNFENESVEAILKAVERSNYVPSVRHEKLIAEAYKDLFSGYAQLQKNKLLQKAIKEIKTHEQDPQKQEQRIEQKIKEIYGIDFTSLRSEVASLTHKCRIQDEAIAKLGKEIETLKESQKANVSFSKRSLKASIDKLIIREQNLNKMKRTLALSKKTLTAASRKLQQAYTQRDALIKETNPDRYAVQIEHFNNLVNFYQNLSEKDRLIATMDSDIEKTKVIYEFDIQALRSKYETENNPFKKLILAIEKNRKIKERDKVLNPLKAQGNQELRKFSALGQYYDALKNHYNFKLKLVEIDPTKVGPRKHENPVKPAETSTFLSSIFSFFGMGTRQAAKPSNANDRRLRR